MNRTKSQPCGLPTSTIKANKEKPMTTKICSGCRRELPATLDYFNRKGRSNDSLRAKCKDCERDYREVNKDHRREVDRQWRRANKEHKAAYMRDYYRKNRKQELARYYRWKEEHREEIKEYWREYCRERKSKKREYDQQYRIANRDKIRAGKKKWVENNRESIRLKGRVYAALRNARKRKTGGSYTKKDIKDQYARQHGKCYYCGQKVGDTYHVDHVVPLSRGGSNSPENLVVACVHCNLSKSNKLPHEWGKRLL